MTSVSNSKKHMESLSALRFVAFLGIFLTHTNFFISWPELSVTVFFCLSGFLLQYRHEGTLTSSFRSDLDFAIRHLKKLYPLHLFTTAFAVVLVLIDMIIGHWMTLKSLVFLAGKIFLSLTLTKSLVPIMKIAISLNGVSWYLSTLLVLYFFFPRIGAFVEKRSSKTLLLTCVLIPVLQICLCIPICFVFGIESDFYAWFMYINPLFRLGDLLAGASLGALFLRNRENVLRKDSLLWSAAEFGMLILSVLVYRFYHMEQPFLILKLFFNQTSPYILPALLWIFLFACRKGILTQLASNSLFLYLGSISAQCYLIHGLLAQAFEAVYRYSGIVLSGRGIVLSVCVQFFLTILLSVLFKKWTEKK